MHAWLEYFNMWANINLKATYLVFLLSFLFFMQMKCSLTYITKIPKLITNL